MTTHLKKIFNGSKRTISAIFTVLAVFVVLFKMPDQQMITAYMYTLIFICVVSGVITADKIILKYLDRK